MRMAKEKEVKSEPLYNSENISEQPNRTTTSNSFSFSGRWINGSNIQVNGSDIIINGKRYVDNNISNCNDKIIHFHINGDVGNIDMTNGEVYCGNVSGDIDITNGSVHCSDIYGDVDITNGNIIKKRGF